MDIKEYSYVLAVAECGSISEAAKTLYISQPALSIYLRNLEARIGNKLFFKSDGKLYFTEIGKRYCAYAQQIVTLDQTLAREMRELQNRECGEVVLGIPVTRSENLLPLILPTFKKKFPGILVKVVDGTSVQIEAMVHERKIDIAVLNYPFKEYELEYTVLGQDEIGVIIPEDRPVCQKAQLRPGYVLPWLDMAELRDEEFILFRKGQRMRQAADQLFHAAGYTPKILWELSSATSIYHLVCSGMGLAVLPAEFGISRGSQGVQVYSVSETPLYYDIVAAYASQEQLSSSAQAMLQTIQNIYQSLAQRKKGDT